MKDAIELAREAGATEFGLKWVGFDGFVKKLITLTRADMLADLVKGAEPVLHIHPDTFAMDQYHVGAYKSGHELPGYIPLYTTEAVAAAVVQRDQRIADLEAQLAAARQDAERYRWLRGNCTSMSVSININGNGCEITETLDDAVDAAIRAAGGVE